MNTWSTLFLSTVFIYIFLGNYVFYKNPRKPLNIFFMLFCLMGAYMGFTDFMTTYVHDIEKANLWILLRQFWPVGVVLLLCTVLAFVKKIHYLKSKYMWIFVYIPTMLFNVVFPSLGIIRYEPVLKHWGFDHIVVGYSEVFTVMLIWVTCISAVMIYLCVRFYASQTAVKTRKQARLFIIAVSFTAISATVDGMFSDAFNYPSLNSLTQSLIPIFISYAMWKYGLFKISPATAAENIISIMPDSLIIIGQDKKMLSVNRALMKLLKYNEKELLGKPVKIMFLEKEYPLIEKSMEGLSTAILQSHFQTHLATKDGKTIPVVLSWSAVVDNDKKAIGRVIIARDITYIKEEERKRDELLTQLVHAEKLAGVGTLTAGIAHEFNNLLQIIKGNAEYAVLTDSQDEVKESLDNIIDTSKRTAKIISNLLTFSRQEKSERSIHSISEIMNSVLLVIENQFIKQKVTVIKLYGKASNVYVNMTDMQQVFINLLVNARDAMIHDGGTITIETRQKGEYVEVTVSDTGKGIDKENLQKVFEPFYTTKGALGGNPEVNGTGLGLSVSYGIIQRSNGTIRIESEQGNGTRVIIQLPVAGGDSDNGDLVGKKEANNEGLAPKSILIIDDEEDICKILEKLLRIKNNEVEYVLDGKTGLKRIKEKNFEVVFLDILMPKISGLDVFKQIRKAVPDAKIIIITGNTIDEKLLSKFKREGIDYYIQKPFSLEAVVKAMS